jgi:hypothetical protein
VHLIGFYYKNRLYVGVYLQGVLVMQAWFCLINFTLLQCCSMIQNVGVTIVVLTVSVVMVMVMMTVTTTGACVGFQRRDRAPSELQQICSNPVPHLEF